jgi:hypothetical protein
MQLRDYSPGPPISFGLAGQYLGLDTNHRCGGLDHAVATWQLTLVTTRTVGDRFSLCPQLYLLDRLYWIAVHQTRIISLKPSIVVSVPVELFSSLAVQDSLSRNRHLDLQTNVVEF